MPGATIATTGQALQGRFQAFPVEDDDHLVTVLRDVERNALRAELVSLADQWKWSSLSLRQCGDSLLWQGEVPVRDKRRLERVNEPLPAADRQRSRLSASRGRRVGFGIVLASPRATTQGAIIVQ
jgi:putative transposase